MKAELEYRAYSVGGDGHITHSHQFIAPNDGAAFEHARQFVDGYVIELWNGDRLVATLKKLQRPGLSEQY